MFLPPNSSELNPIEGLWKWLKESIINNVSFSSIQKIVLKVREFINDINQHPETIVLCKVHFDEDNQVLFLEDLEQQVGSTIDVADYMVGAGYIENISLCDVRRWPLHFWLREGIRK